jgi:hypothetical protein
MFYYLVWVDMYTPGGSAFEFHFIAHDCQITEEFRIVVLTIPIDLFISAALPV